MKQMNKLFLTWLYAALTTGVFLSAVYVITTDLIGMKKFWLKPSLELHTYTFSDSGHIIRGVVQVFQPNNLYSAEESTAPSVYMQQMSGEDLAKYPRDSTGRSLLIGQREPGYDDLKQ